MRKTKSGTPTKLFLSYPSLEALVRASTGDSGMTDGERSSRYSSRDSWYGAPWEDAVKLGLYGDMEGAKRLSPTILEGANSIVKNQPRLDPVFRLDGGRWIDVARFVKGEPECWGDMIESEPTPRKGIAIIVDVACSGSTSPDAIEKAGVAIGSAILGAQATGHSVTLYAVDHITNYSESDTLTISAPLNPGGSILDISKLSVVLRTWFQRRIVFSLQETQSQEIRSKFNIGGGYGRVADLSKADAKRITGLDNTVVLSVHDLARNPDKVKEIIFGQLKNGGH